MTKYFVHYCKDCGQLVEVSRFYLMNDCSCPDCGCRKLSYEEMSKEELFEKFFKEKNRYGGLTSYSSDVKLHGG